jgi:hypothetical protein
MIEARLELKPPLVANQYPIAALGKRAMNNMRLKLGFHSEPS